MVYIIIKLETKTVKGRGIPKKIIQELKSQPEDRDSSKIDETKVKRLQYKNDHSEEVRLKQNERYQKIKEELQLKILCHTIFSDKYTDDQRAKLAEKLAEHKSDTSI